MLLGVFNSGDFVIAEFASVVYMYQCCKGTRCARKEKQKSFLPGVGLEPKQIKLYGLTF